MSSPEAPFDSGLQPERTLLAWRRTSLSLAVASAVGVRLTAYDFGGVAVAAGIIGVTLSLGSYLMAAHRYRRAHRSLLASARLSSGGLALTALAVACVLLGSIALAWLCAD